MGLHLAEMETVWEEGVSAGLWDNNHHVTEKCMERFKELLKKVEYLKTEDKHRMSILPEDVRYMYVPETFRGLK